MEWPYPRGVRSPGARRASGTGRTVGAEATRLRRTNEFRNMADKDGWRSRRPRKRGFDDDFPMAGRGGGGGWAPPAELPVVAAEPDVELRRAGNRRRRQMVQRREGLRLRGGRGRLRRCLSPCERAAARRRGQRGARRPAPRPRRARPEGRQVTEMLEIKEGTAPPPPQRSGSGSALVPASRRAPGSGEEMRGIVKWYNAQKGFGFVTPESAARTCSSTPPRSNAAAAAARRGQTVTMTVVPGRKGPEAATVRGD